MNTNKIFILLLLLSLTLLFCVGTVSASTESNNVTSDNLTVSGVQTTSNSSNSTINNSSGSGNNQTLPDPQIYRDGVAVDRGHGAGYVYTSIQAAINDAQPGDTIMLESGTYHEHIIVNKNLDFRVFSGYANLINTISGAGPMVTINSGVTATFQNVGILNGATGTCRGIDNNGILTLDNCQFALNRADFGGAIYNRGILTVRNCSFFRNYASIGGGAIYTYGSCTIINTIFDENAAGELAGAIYNTDAHCDIIGCTFTQNQVINPTNGFGSAIVNLQSPSGSSIVTVTGSTFTENSAYTGTIWNYGTLTVNFNYIYNNIATTTRSGILGAFGTVNAEYNWWGSNSGPGGVNQYVNVNRWLMLSLFLLDSTSTETPPYTQITGLLKGQTAKILANLYYDNMNGYHNPASAHVPNGIPIIFNTDWGTLSATSTTLTNGQSAVTFTANGALLGPAHISATVNTATATKTLNILNNPPVLNSIGNKIVDEGQTLSFTVSGTDDFGDTLSYSATGLPAGASINPATGLFTWTPTFNQAGIYTITFRVSDGTLSDGETITITVNNVNRAPIANAGSNQNVNRYTLVNLDGSGSLDPDSDALTYSWTLITPSGSSAVLSNPNSVSPSFTPDIPGTYQLQLTVTDTYGATSTSTVTVTAVNRAPIANAGSDQTVNHNSLVNLDGSGSSDPDGDALTYSWTLTRPAGSSTVLSNPNSANPSFTPDVPGSYQLQLTVTDIYGATDTSTVTITAVNRAPVANAGSDQTVNRYTLVNLDGSGSLDPDSDSLTYSWTLTTPAGSSATLSNPSSVNPSFTVDLPGSYQLQLTVTDIYGATSTSTVTITAVNRAPVANAGSNQNAYCNDVVNLDGSGSLDADGDALTYSWTLTTPAGSSSVLSNLNSVNPSFTADLPGIYQLQLTVTDIYGAISTSTITVTVNKIPTTLRIDNVRGNKDETVTLKATLKDNANNPLYNKTVEFWVSGVKVGENTTDADGIATFNYKITQLHGNYTIMAVFNGETRHISSNVDGKLYVPKSDLYIRVTLSKANPKIGETFIITYKLGNSGPDTAENVTITIPLPEGFEISKITGDGNWTYNETTRTITWTFANVPVGDPYLYISGKVLGPGTYVFGSSIASDTYSLNTEGVTPITINAVSQTSTTVNAASKTIPLQETGLPLAGLVMAILAVLGGLVIPKRK